MIIITNVQRPPDFIKLGRPYLFKKVIYKGNNRNMYLLEKDTNYLYSLSNPESVEFLEPFGLFSCFEVYFKSDGLGFCVIDKEQFKYFGIGEEVKFVEK